MKGTCTLNERFIIKEKEHIINLSLIILPTGLLLLPLPDLLLAIPELGRACATRYFLTVFPIRIRFHEVLNIVQCCHCCGSVINWPPNYESEYWSRSKDSKKVLKWNLILRINNDLLPGRYLFVFEYIYINGHKMSR
jgi:hypothetical protein